MSEPSTTVGSAASGRNARPTDSVLQRITRLAGRSLRAPAAWVVMAREAQSGQVAAWFAEDAPAWLLQWAPEPHVLSACRCSEPLFAALLDAPTGCAAIAGNKVAFAAAPFATSPAEWGVLCVAKPAPHRWTGDERAILVDLAASLAAQPAPPVLHLHPSATEDERRETEARYQLMVEGSEQVFFYEHDPEHRFIYLSPSVHAVMGYAATDLAGHPFEEVLAGGDADLNVQELTDAALLSGERSPPYYAEIRRPDGEIRTLELVESPVIREGRVVGMQGFARDVTDRVAREEELHLKTAYLDRLIESAPEAVVLLDNQDHVVRVNQEFTRMFGYAADEVVGRRIDDLIVPDSQRSQAVEIAATMSGGDRVDLETVRRRKDGGLLDVWILGAPIRVRGSQMAVYGIYRDISERKQAEAALRRSEEHFRSLIEHSSDLILVLDEQGRMKYVSASVERLLGYTSDAVLQSSVLEFVHPEDRVQLAALFAPHAGQTAPLGSPLEIRVRRRDGEWRMFEAVGRNLGRDPAVQGWVINSRDITERHRAEAQLTAAEAHYRRLVEASPYGIYSLDERGRYVEVNPVLAEILGRPVSECIGLHFDRVLAPEDMERAQASFAGIIAGHRDETTLQTYVVRASGERRLVQIRAKAIRRGDQVMGMHGVVRDITDEHAREIQLRRAERLASLGTLLSGVAHELNNPLTSIKSFAQLLLLDERSPQDAEALEIVHREAERAAKIVADLRRMTPQPEPGAVQRGPVDLNDVVRHVLRVRRYALVAQGVQVEEQLAANLPPAWADRGQLEQMVFNLVLNSEQAVAGSQGERWIRLRTKREAACVVLVVEDTGAGIHPEYLERIFDPFFTTKQPGEGTGLGLSLLHRMVAEHGGQVRAFSEPGRGARFVLRLPNAARSGENADSATAPRRRAARNNRVGNS